MILCKAYLQEVVFENSSSDHETRSIRWHVRIHVDFTSILHSQTYFGGPSSVVWSSELGQPALPFPANESAWSAMVMGSQSRVWSGFRCIDNNFKPFGQNLILGV